jgi:hypothetical protein
MTQFKRLLLGMVLLLCLQGQGKAAVIFLYDFPGGSGVAASQTNGQPSGATFGDFTRANLNSTSSGNVFASVKWNTGGSIDTTEFLAFSITATGPNGHLNLTNLTFDNFIGSPTGPANMQVALFLNGSTTAYATMNFTPTTSVTSQNFDFTDLTDADWVTTATFKFFGWNAGGPAGEFDIDNVATNGAISSLPETNSAWPIAFLSGVCLAAEFLRRRTRRRLPR